MFVLFFICYQAQRQYWTQSETKTYSDSHVDPVIWGDYDHHIDEALCLSVDLYDINGAYNAHAFIIIDSFSNVS